MNKVLIINSTAIGEKKGTGVTLRNIWKDYPRENILQLIIDWNDTEKDKDIPTVQTPVDFCRVPYMIHKRLYKKRKGIGGVANGSIKQKGFKPCLHDCFRGMLDIFPINYDCIMDVVRKFSPDVIYTCGPSIRILKTVNYISDKLNIPVILHLMDNWPETIYTTSPLSFIYHRTIKRYLRKIHKKSKMNLAISKALSEKYSLIYGVEYKMLMNPAMHIEDNVHHITGAPKFLYTGSLNLNRWKSLLEIARVIDSYRKKGKQLEFKLYVPQNDVDIYIKKFQQYGAVVNPYVTAEKLQEIYNENDVLVFAESFDKEIIDFAKYSLSTKIPEYMATGHLIIAYLPDELCSSQYLKKNNLAIVTSKIEDFKATVEKLVSFSEDYSVLAENSLKKAKESHSIDACKKQLHIAIRANCEGDRF